MNYAAGRCRPVPTRLRAAATADGISSDRRHLHIKIPHREDVDFLAIVLSECRGVRGGETCMDGADGRYAGRFKQRECGSLLLLDDARELGANLFERSAGAADDQCVGIHEESFARVSPGFVPAARRPANTGLTAKVEFIGFPLRRVDGRPAGEHT